MELRNHLLPVLLRGGVSEIREDSISRPYLRERGERKGEEREREREGVKARKYNRGIHCIGALNFYPQNLVILTKILQSENLYAV